MRDGAARPVTQDIFCASTDRAHLAAAGLPHQCLGPAHPKPAAAKAAAALSTSGHVLRVTGPVMDGFWVRALVVLSHALWARRVGLPLDVRFPMPISF